MESREIKKLASGTGAIFVGGVLGNGLNYIVGIIIARLVGVQLVGLYYLLLVLVNLGSSVARVGFSDALLRFVPPARLKGDHNEARGIIKTTVLFGILTSVLFSIGVYFALPWINYIYPIDATLASYLSWFIWTLPLHVLFVLLVIAIQANQKMVHVAIARDFLQPLLMFIFTVLLIVYGSPKIGFVGGYAISLILAIIYAVVYLNKLSPGMLSRSQRMVPIRPVLLFSLPIMLSDVVHYLYRWIDTFLISYYLELEHVGIYNAAMRTSLLLSLIFLAANAIYATMASGFFHTGQVDKLKSALQLSTRWCFLLALPVVIMLVVGGKWLLLIWGSEFGAGASTMGLLGLAQLINIPSGIIAYTMLMCGRQNVEVINTFILLVVLFGLNVVCIPYFGIIGAAIALCVTSLGGMTLRWFQVKTLYGIQPFNSKLTKPFIAGAVSFVLTLVLRDFVISYWMGTNSLMASTFQLVGILLTLFSIISITFLLSCFLLGFEDEDKVVFDDVFRRHKVTKAIS